MIMVFGVMVIILCGAKVMMVPPPNRIVLVILRTCGQMPRAIIVLGPCPAIQCKNDQNCCSEKQRKAEPTHGRPHTS